MGLTDVRFVHAEKTGFGAQARAAALTQAGAHIAKLAGESLVRAA
jgi:FMN-dependent NADH-azoreductase